MTFTTIRRTKSICLFLLFFWCIKSNAQIRANFSGNPISGCSPLLVNFIDSSTGNPVAYQWDLGNGTQSTLQNPSVTYFTPGTYTVTLIVTDASGLKDTLVKPNYISVFAKPTVNFSASDTLGCFPLTTTFTDLSTPGSGTNVSWLWDFGDGTSSTLQNPVKTYNQGTFTVVLRVTNSNGCNNTLVKSNYIRAINGVIAGFTFVNPNSCSTPVTINFTNTSTGTGILSYLWNFGDGNTSTLQNPSHTYPLNGAYTVSLTTTNNQGCTNTYTHNSTINIGNIQADFSMADSVCVNAPLSITNTSTPQVTNVNWYFGDGTTSTQINPIKVYTTPGLYIVKLVADFGACKDSIQKVVRVLPKPTANFTANQTTSCRVPFTVNFTSTSANAVSYQWNFGDGNTSNLPNPTNTYNTLGNYDVTLIVTNNLGCNDTIRRINFIRIQAPSVSFTNLPDSGCNPLTIFPLYTVNSIDGIANYQWNFGDGATSTLANPSHTYTVSGIYTIKLIITTNGGCMDSTTSIVKVGTKPNVQFSATPVNTCAFFPVQFTDATTGNATYYYWQFGDGGTSFEQNPTYPYQDTGYFTVTLIVGNNGCYDTLIKPNYIYIRPPIARFTPTMTCATPFDWSFTDQSIAPLTWSWQFGDGATSTIQNPTHTYALPGAYTITLTVTNGSCTHTTTRLINVVNENPDFVADQVEICRNSNVAFSSIGYNRVNISSFTWNFGDGTTLAGDSTINHVYTQSGVYTVSLTTIDINGCSKTVTKNLYITVFGPVANFVASAPGTCLNTPIAFNDLSTTDGIHNILNWQWNYGDGNTQNYTAPPFIHQYATDGSYTVTLKVTDNYGCTDSITKVNALIIARPIADFTSIDTASCPNRDIAFNNTSLGSNLTYTWDFGDGTISSQTSPIHQYVNDGVYTVTLKVIDQYGCTDSIVKSNYVHIITPIASFIASDTFSTCPPLFVQFTNQSTSFTSYSWDFGDGATSNNLNPSHFYTTPGTFIAKLTITSSGGCVSVFTKTIRIQGPTGTFTYTPLQGCNPLTVNFNATTFNATSYVYDFNNGVTNSTSSTQISYTYTQNGKYLPRMILKDNNGCSIPILGLDSITVYGITSNISASSVLLCDSGLVNFNANAISNDVINNYAWSFGDGSTGVGQNPSHFYTATGNYNIRCIITTNLGCIDTATMVMPMRIAESPVINFTTNNGACIPATATFNPQIIRSDTSALQWHWDFGNGQTSNVMNPPNMVYTNAGNYNVTTIAKSSSGCADTVTQVFQAWGLPNVDAGPDRRMCRFTPATLTATGATNYTWSPSNGLSCVNCSVTVAAPNSNQTYYVQGIDGNGCINNDSIKLEVVQPFAMQKGPDVSFCSGGFAPLFASGANTYNWSPSTGLSATNTPQVIARPLVTTTYRVVGSDSFNCFKDTAYITVRVSPIPTVNAGADVTISAGSSTTLSTTTTGGVIGYTWTPSATLSCNSCPTTIAKPLLTTTYKVEVTNEAGCKNNDEVTVHVICNNGNLFVPNTFSPNGDGVNDIMYPRGNGIYQIKTFKIFDRWGELVYEQNYFGANDPSKGWDGTFKGKKLNPDVYVYIIEVLCTDKTPIGFKGNITLVK